MAELRFRLERASDLQTMLLSKASKVFSYMRKGELGLSIRKCTTRRRPRAATRALLVAGRRAARGLAGVALGGPG